MSAWVIQGSDKLIARLRAVADTEHMMREVALESVASAKNLVPRRTGNLARTIRVQRVTKDYLEIAAGGRREVGYAAAVEFGSKAHTIVPRKAKVLAWGGARTLGGRLRKGAKAEFFARKVKHPGSRPRPYLVPGLEFGVAKVALRSIIDAWNRGA